LVADEKAQTVAIVARQSLGFGYARSVLTDFAAQNQRLGFD
jgi:hypothetical protein